MSKAIKIAALGLLLINTLSVMGCKQQRTEGKDWEPARQGHPRPGPSEPLDAPPGQR